VRTSQTLHPPTRSQEISKALAPQLKQGPFDPSPVIPNPIGEGTVRLAVIPIGYEDDCGVLVAGSGQPDFPSQSDQLLLGVASNQAAIVLQHKRSEESLRRQSKALQDERELLREAQERLRVQGEWLRVTLGSIGDAVIATDTEGRVTFLNSVAQELTGWTPVDAQGQPLAQVFAIIHEHTRQPVANPVEKVLRDGVIVGLGNHTVLIARDGTERPIDDSAAPIRDAAGEMIGVVLIFRDVTEQRRADRKVRQSEARKSAILDTALDCIITMDHDGRVAEFNPAAERTFGHRRERVIGRELADLIIPPSLRERHQRGMAHYLATDEGPVLGKRLELPALRADGWEVAITRISTDGPPLFTAYLRDITEQKRVEQHRNVRLAVTHALSEATRDTRELLRRELLSRR
jgi:PAS domain S-box-containing protein